MQTTNTEICDGAQEDEKSEKEFSPKTVPIRFALGKSMGIHAKPSVPPKTLTEARKAALRYARSR